MNVPESASRGTRVRLPPDVARPFEIYVNGVPQEEGRDFRIEGRTLVFEQELKGEGKLGFWRWLSMWVGVAGTYRQNDSVDVVYQRNGKRVVETQAPSGAGLEPKPPPVVLDGGGASERDRGRRGSFASTRRARARSTGSTSPSRRVRSTAFSGRTAPASRRLSTS